ncbi:HisA/HisF-related TIM barrel protein [Hyphobacterium sp.]|uniref:1-(5-phosphoribosyl)-5-[(5- phosphoribosylamino)methylideneamino]imidazole-4- carboxamide isomerase n=1 Tax=Hyphobacterium sp. TaxID=2004662 RepID=UPI003BA96CF6
MILYPAIDLLDGRVVRLTKGDFSAVTDYGDDPVAVAESYAALGAQWLHVVDLSGARDGTRRQTATISDLANCGLKVQVGGGIRKAVDIDALINAGASRVIVGSLAVTAPEQVASWISRYGPEKIVAAFDVRIEDGEIWPTTSGWTQSGAEPLAGLLEHYAGSGLRHALVTDVAKDGALEGPNVYLYSNLTALRPDIAWQASGGVAALSDLSALAKVGASGAIIGKALYEGRFTLAEAMACLPSG